MQQPKIESDIIYQPEEAPLTEPEDLSPSEPLISQGEEIQVVEPEITPEMEQQQQEDVDVMAGIPKPEEIDFNKVDMYAGAITAGMRQVGKATKNMLKKVKKTTLTDIKAKPKETKTFTPEEDEELLTQLNTFVEKNQDVVFTKDDKPNFQPRQDYKPDLVFDLSSIEDGDDIQLAVKAMADMLQKDINVARRGEEGILHDIEVQKLAQDLLQDPVKMLQILQKPDGSTANVEEIVAMGLLWKQSAASLNEAIRKANLFQAKLLSKIMGYRAEGARSLRIMGQVGLDMEQELGFSQEELINLAFSGYDAKTLAKLMQGADTSKAVTHKVQMTKSLSRQVWDKAMEHWMMSILSGTTTQLVNIVGISAQFAANNIDRFIAETSTRAMILMGRDTSNLVAPGETAAYMTGEVLSIKQALKTAWEVMKTGDVYDGGKLVATNSEWSADKWEKFGLDPNSISARILAGYAKHINGGMVTHVMGATDALGKVLGENAEYTAYAYRKTFHEIAILQREGVYTDETLNAMFVKRFTELLENPSEEMLETARLAGQKLTFQDTNELSNKLRSFLNYTVVGRLFIPFINTPLSSVMKNLVERTPGVGMMVGGATDGGIGTQMALAKQTTGLAIIGYFGWLNEQGHFTGSEPDFKSAEGRKALAVWEAQKRMELSYMTDEEFQIYLGRIEQISYLAQVTADINQLMKSKEFEYEVNDTPYSERVKDLTNKVFQSLMHNLQNKSFLQGFADFSDLLDRGLIVEFMQKRAVAGLPLSSLRRQVTQTMFPNKKDRSEFIDSIKADMLWLSKEVPDKLDMFGNPVPVNQPLTPVKVGVQAKTFKTKPGPDTYITDMFTKMYAKIHKIPYGKMNRTQQDIKLTSRQYHDLQVLARKNFSYEGQSYSEVIASVIDKLPKDTEQDLFFMYETIKTLARDMDAVAWKVFVYGSEGEKVTLDGKAVEPNEELMEKLRKREEINLRKKGKLPQGE